MTLYQSLHLPALEVSSRRELDSAESLESRHGTLDRGVASRAPWLIDGGDFWASLGIVVASGVGGSTILALRMVPAVRVDARRGAGKSARPTK